MGASPSYWKCANNKYSISFADRSRVFAGGLTHVEVNIVVTDSQTGAVKTCTNPENTPFQPIQDTDAFATCP